MKQPRITVVTPNYNRGRFLERAICSVLDQGYDNIEYFVIDGGSTDDSVDIIRLYEDELAGWVSEPDDGSGEAINKGLTRATGDIIAFLNSDDVFLPGTLLDVAAAMAAPDGPDWVVGQSTWINSSDLMLDQHASSAPDSLASFLMHDSGNLPGAGSFWSRRLFDDVGSLDPSLSFAFDYEFACRLLARGYAPTLMHQPLVGRRRHPGHRDATGTVAAGLEYIDAARRYAEHLPLGQRYALWTNCDTRRRIYALAEAETQGPQSRRFLWQQLIRHPWWIANDAVRHAVLRGISHPLPQELAARTAA